MQLSPRLCFYCRRSRVVSFRFSDYYTFCRSFLIRHFFVQKQFEKNSVKRMLCFSNCFSELFRTLAYQSRAEGLGWPGPTRFLDARKYKFSVSSKKIFLHSCQKNSDDLYPNFYFIFTFHLKKILTSHPRTLLCTPLTITLLQIISFQSIIIALIIRALINARPFNRRLY